MSASTMLPALNEALAAHGCEIETTYRRADGPRGGDHLLWPQYILDDFADAERMFRSRVGELDVIGNLWACVKYAGDWWCARQIHFIRVKSADLTSSLPSDHDSEGGSDGAEGRKDSGRPSASVGREFAHMTSAPARPVSEWHEDIGPVLWWCFPINEPPYVGTPNEPDAPLFIAGAISDAYAAGYRPDGFGGAPLSHARAE